MTCASLHAVVAHSPGGRGTKVHVDSIDTIDVLTSDCLLIINRRLRMTAINNAAFADLRHPGRAATSTPRRRVRLPKAAASAQLLFVRT